MMTVNSQARSARSQGVELYFDGVLTKSGEVIELDRQHMLALVQTDAELGDIMMRAFVLRRLELVAAGMGDVVLIGSMHSADTHRIKEFLVRNGYPYTYIELERDHDVENMLDSFHITANELPVLICRGEVVLRNPSNPEIATCLGFNDSIDQTQGPRFGYHRSRSFGISCGSIWRLRRTRRSSAGNGFSRRSGRFKL